MSTTTITTIPQTTLSSPSHFKSALVDLGLFALDRGEWAMVQAITCLIEQRELRHA